MEDEPTEAAMPDSEPGLPRPPWDRADWDPIADPVERASVLDRFERYLTGITFDDPGSAESPLAQNLGLDARHEGLDWPSAAFTMVGSRRLRSLRTLVEAALVEGIPGDFVETGVWRGGASMMVRAVLALHGATDRAVVLADSFEGLPPPSGAYEHDQSSDLHLKPELAVSLEEVRDNFAQVGLLDDQVRFVPGWFRDTMPTLDVESIALLRLDGDMYESTIDPLRYLYGRVSPGGWVVIDDYYLIDGCQRAVHDFLDEAGLDVGLERIDLVGAFIRKSLEA